MITHGDDFEPESEFGQCLVGEWMVNLMDDYSDTFYRVWACTGTTCAYSRDLYCGRYHYVA